MAKRKTTAAATAEAQGTLPDTVEQPHGGALYRGGVPGNRGGHYGGKRPSEIRALFREDLMATRQLIIETVGDREPCPTCKRKTTDADLIRLADFFAKFSLGPAKGGIDPALVIEMSESVRRIFEATDEQMEALYEAWAPTLGRHAAGE